MGDVVDMATNLQDEHLEHSLRRARLPIAAGVPGECEQCFDDSPRLVGGRCAFCRDGRRRPTNPIGKMPTPGPAPVTEDIMNAKSIQLPASAQVAIQAVERHAQSAVLSLGAAAAELIVRGIDCASAPAAASLSDELDVDALLDLIRTRFAGRPDQSADLAAAIGRAEAAEARAKAAETALAKIREALAA